MKWSKKDYGIGNVEPFAILLDQEISIANLIEMWEKFFTDSFSTNPGKKWDSVRCEVQTENWYLSLYPYSRQREWADIDARLWVELPGHYDAIHPLAFGDGLDKFETCIDSVQVFSAERLVWLSYVSFQEFAKKTSFWQRTDMEDISVEIWFSVDKAMASVTRDAVVFDDPYPTT